MAAAPLPPVSPGSTAAATPAPMSEASRIVDTFIAPSKTFTDLRRSAAWWGPWIVISIVSIIFIYVIGKQIGFEQVSRNQIEHSKRAEQFDKLPADQQERQLQLSVKIFNIFGYGSPVLILFYFLVSTTVLWATFKIATAADTSFGQAYAITIYAALPSIVGAILGIISLFAGANPEGFDINNPVGTNLAYYLDPESVGKFIRGLASAVDVINIWTVILIGIGYSCTSKVKRSTAITIVAGWYLFYEVLKASLSTLG
jgi:hypothetical protein